MRSGPEQKIHARVTTVTTDTSIVLTRQATQSLDADPLITTMTILMAKTGGYRVGEDIEVTLRSLGG